MNVERVLATREVVIHVDASLRISEEMIQKYEALGYLLTSFQNNAGRLTPDSQMALLLHMVDLCGAFERGSTLTLPRRFVDDALEKLGRPISATDPGASRAINLEEE